MMDDGMGGMMWSTGIGHLLILVIALLVVAALVKYVFFR